MPIKMTVHAIPLACLLIIVACSGDEFNSPECTEKLPRRTEDLIITQNLNPELVVVSLDTAPTKASNIFEHNLKTLGYDYILLGSTKDNPQPPNNGVFKLALWNYRFHRYLDQIKTIAQATPNRIVALSDANDVIFVSPPQEIVSSFKAFKKSIVLSGTMYCCNIDRFHYVKKMAGAQTPPITNIESTDPATLDIIKILADRASTSPEYFGLLPAPLYLWTPQAQAEIRVIKRIPLRPDGPATKNRFVNAGGIIGYANALLQAMEEINSQPYNDDEELWNTWYGKVGGGFDRGAAIIDYEQRIFAVVDEMSDRDDEVRILFDDYIMANKSLPESKFFNFSVPPNSPRWTSIYDTTPGIFHCAGCKPRNMHDYRIKLFEQEPTLKSSLDKNLQDFLQKC